MPSGKGTWACRDAPWRFRSYPTGSVARLAMAEELKQDSIVPPIQEDALAPMPGMEHMSDSKPEHQH